MSTKREDERAGASETSGCGKRMMERMGEEKGGEREISACMRTAASQAAAAAVEQLC